MLHILNELFFGSGSIQAIAPLVLAAIFAGTQMIKQKQANEQAQKQAQMGAISTKFSPWLSGQAQANIANTPVQGPNALTSGLMGAAEGYLSSKLVQEERLSNKDPNVQTVQQPTQAMSGRDRILQQGPKVSKFNYIKRSNIE